MSHQASQPDPLDRIADESEDQLNALHAMLSFLTGYHGRDKAVPVERLERALALSRQVYQRTGRSS